MITDQIILGLIWIIISEIIFIIFRIFIMEHEDWIQTKLISFLIGGFAMFIQYTIVVADNYTESTEVIYHWNRLIYEVYGIVGIALLFLINYGISKLIDKLKND